MWQILSLDKFYSDTHPGNILILPNNQYALVDFGVLGPTVQNKRSYYQLIQILTERADSLDAESLSTELFKLGAHKLHACITIWDHHNLQSNKRLKAKIIHHYQKEIESLRESFRQIEIEEVENYTKMWNMLLQSGEQFQLMLPDGLFAALRSSALIKSFATFLDPDFHFMRGVYGQLTQTIQPERLINEQDLKSNRIGLEEASEYLAEWLSRLAEWDTALYTRLHRVLH